MEGSYYLQTIGYCEPKKKKLQTIGYDIVYQIQRHVKEFGQ